MSPGIPWSSHTYIFFFHSSPSTGQKHHFSKGGRMRLREIYWLAFVVGAEITSRVIIRAETEFLWYFYAVLCSTLTRKSCTCPFKRNEELTTILKQWHKMVFSRSVFWSCLAGRNHSLFCSENPSVAAVKVTVVISTYCINVGISLRINLKLPFCRYLYISLRVVWCHFLHIDVCKIRAC